ncbi:mitochondrial inner membrane protease subunit 2 isoform X1 [Heterodontus francisci]|uniref:mitochondrial inner membrane protease subunit 2 isoform X1 n=1 Tax=Heterodontus francisci TaxID=7792 RepID=UPI00355C044D
MTYLLPSAVPLRYSARLLGLPHLWISIRRLGSQGTIFLWRAVGGKRGLLPDPKPTGPNDVSGSGRVAFPGPAFGLGSGRAGWDTLYHHLRSPKNPEQKIIKRVIALEGDIIRTMGYRNRYIKIPNGHLWIEGDHHGHSFDSNAFGPVSLGLVHARASHIIWPPNRWMKLQPDLPEERRPLLSESDEPADETSI